MRSALGPVPTDAAARRDWEHKASAIAAYREMYGYDHPADPIGPEPSQNTPSQRAAWHLAFAALGPADGPDVRAIPDGQLWLLRDTYTTETEWAPRHTGKELRLARLGTHDASLGAIRAVAEAQAARKAGDHARAVRHDKLAASYQAIRDHYQQQEQILTQAMADRQQWEHATADNRHLAIAADAELRRRHPDEQIEPLRSAEPAPITGTEPQPRLTPDQKTAETATWIHDLAAQHQAFLEKLEQRHQLKASTKDQNWPRLGQPFPAWQALDQDAILQPPKPEITPSAKILQHAAEHDTEPEAAD